MSFSGSCSIINGDICDHLAGLARAKVKRTILGIPKVRVLNINHTDLRITNFGGELFVFVLLEDGFVEADEMSEDNFLELENR